MMMDLDDDPSEAQVSKSIGAQRTLRMVCLAVSGPSLAEDEESGERQAVQRRRGAEQHAELY